MSNATNRILDAMLKEKFAEFTVDDSIRWNFTKFLVDQEGNILERFESTVEHMDIEPYLQQIL